MAHQVPKELKGEERVLNIPWMNLYLNKKGLVYNGSVTLFSAIILKLTGNFYLFAILFLVLNVIAYPLAHSTTAKNRFEGGNVKQDIYIMRKLKYRKNRNVYLRKRSGKSKC